MRPTSRARTVEMTPAAKHSLPSPVGGLIAGAESRLDDLELAIGNRGAAARFPLPQLPGGLVVLAAGADRDVRLLSVASQPTEETQLPTSASVRHGAALRGHRKRKREQKGPP